MIHASRILVFLIVTATIQNRGAAFALGSTLVTTHERMVEWTIESHKTYSDPFNDVDVDVIFTRGNQSWRVPAFWRGGQRWTVRFAPPSPGEFAYRLQSTDQDNPDLNGHDGVVMITAYTGDSTLLQHGALRVSVNRRHFEHADGTPFFWLGDTWWTGLSDRLSWAGFQELTADRKAKGFTLVQIVAGLVPPEELAPVDPGFHNEGGFVWDAQFKQINPRYFDYADRRIFHLLSSGIVPAIVGGWNPVLAQMGIAKMKQHWRYIIGRYGAFPVLWIVGGEVMDPPEQIAESYDDFGKAFVTRGWTEVARYLRDTDPYHHPITVHEAPPPLDTPLQDESLTDFDLFQSNHLGWPSIGIEVAQLNQHYSRSAVTKPIVEGEIGYEKLGETHFEDFQRTAFWLSMLNGAAGHTYGANGTWEAYTGDKPLQRSRHSFLSWEEGMRLPGSYQVGLGAKLLQTYPWWRFEPHPEWVTPRGTTLLEPHSQTNGFAFGNYWPPKDSEPGDRMAQLEADYGASEWKARQGTFRLPYAAGIARAVRLIYVPAVGYVPPEAPTVLGLENGVCYHAYWWEASSGTRIDLGMVGRPSPGKVVLSAAFDVGLSSDWKNYGPDKTVRRQGMLAAQGDVLVALNNVREKDAAASVSATKTAQTGLLLRFQDPDNYVAAVYSPEARILYLIERRDGADGHWLGRTPVSALGAPVNLSAEVQGGQAVASVTDGERTYTTPIVNLSGEVVTGSAGILHLAQFSMQTYSTFQLRRGPLLVEDKELQRSIYDAKGGHRGELVGDGMMIGTFKILGWDSLQRDKHILLDAYRPDRLPAPGDWILVLDALAGADKLSGGKGDHATGC